MKKRICVVFTGGTIGSSVKGGKVSLDSSSRSLLINTYAENYGKDIAFDELYPVDMLSENVRKINLEKIVECIGGIDLSAYDGIIVTHGTDTLCFSANYLSQVFCGISLPVVLVSSSYPLSDKRSNGLTNFAGAVSFIEKAGVKGVFVSYANDAEPCKIHLASRLIDAEQIRGNFESLLSLHYGIIKDGGFVYNDDPRNPTAEELNNAKPQGLSPELCEDVMVIPARALLNFDIYSFDVVRPKAVVLNLYHSGTICTVGDSTNAVKFAERCMKNGIEVVLSTIMSDANVYDGMENVFGDCIRAYDTSHEMTVVKVMLALGSGTPLQAALSQNNFFEMLS